jgi:hypothetical protein
MLCRWMMTEILLLAILKDGLEVAARFNWG